MIRFNQGYGYSKKYQEVPDLQAQQLLQHKQLINDKTKKLCIENKKRRRQFEERQRIHERNEQKRREEALNSRRRRQQEATNAYKAALNKEITKRNKTPSSRVSSASSTGTNSSNRRHIYRSPTVDEVLSNIRGHSLGGSLRTYGEATNTPTRPPSSNSNSTYTPPTYTQHVVSFTSPNNQDNDCYKKYDKAARAHLASDIRSTLEKSENNALLTGVSGVQSNVTYPGSMGNDSKNNSTRNLDINRNGPEMLATAVYSKHTSLDNDPRSDVTDYSHVTHDTGILRDSLEAKDLEDNFEGDAADRIRVQIDLTKFDQLDVSDCESLDDPPIDPTTNDYNPPISRDKRDTAPRDIHGSRDHDKHTESITDMSKLSNGSSGPVQLLQYDNIRNRTTNYFGPSNNDNNTTLNSTPLTTLHVSNSEPNVVTNEWFPQNEKTIRKTSSHVGLFSKDTHPKLEYSKQEQKGEPKPNYTIQTSGEESHIYASSPVEAVKAASHSNNSRTCWNSPDCTTDTPQKHLKSLIKRTPSGRKKQVRWDSVNALDDQTMEVDQFDISSEGEAVFTRQYSHPTTSRPGTTSPLYNRDCYSDVEAEVINLQRTPTDAEINALWSKVRSTLHRNQAWDAPQSKATLPGHRASNAQTGYNRRAESSKHMQDSLKIYANVLVDKDRYKVSKKQSPSKQQPTQSHYGPSYKMTDITENGHTMLSMEEHRILQSLERLDAKLKDNPAYDIEPKPQVISYTSPSLEVNRPGSGRNDTYRRLLNRKTNGLSSKYR